MYINLYFFFIINNCKSLRTRSKMHVIYPIVLTKYDKLYIHARSKKKKKVASIVISRNSIHLITINVTDILHKR